MPQLYEEYLASNERITVSLPSRKYSRSFSLHFFEFISEFYGGLLRQSDSVRTCSLCSGQHGQNYLCLPEFVQAPSIDLLFDILEWKRGYLSFEEDLVALVRLCGYLLIKTNVIHAFLVNLLSLDEVRTSKGVSVLCYELYWNGFLATSEYFSQGVDHPSFYGLLETCPSYRNVKRKLRSFHRYSNFARTYTYASGRVKFSRVRAAFFWDFYQPPERDGHFINGW